MGNSKLHYVIASYITAHLCLNHHLQATGVGCYVRGAWVNSLSYADDMVLLAPTVTALQTLVDLMTLYTITGSVLDKSQARK